MFSGYWNSKRYDYDNVQMWGGFGFVKLWGAR